MEPQEYKTSSDIPVVDKIKYNRLSRKDLNTGQWAFFDDGSLIYQRSVEGLSMYTILDGTYGVISSIETEPSATVMTGVVGDYLYKGPEGEYIIFTKEEGELQEGVK